jgi:hypothetical protein
MAAFRFFDPWATLDNAAVAAGGAKVANPAKPDKGRPTTLANLATLAGLSGDRAAPYAPSEPPILRPADGELVTWGEAEEGRAAIVDHDRRRPRTWAEERRAVVRWINDHFASSPIGQCVHCGRGARSDDPFVMLFAGEDRADVHPSCWGTWQATQETRALAALATDPHQPKGHS